MTKLSLVFLAGAAIVVALPQSFVPVSQTGFSRYPSVITDPCGEAGQPACCSNCFDGDITYPGDDIGAERKDLVQSDQKKSGCSCPKGCTAGGDEGKKYCV